MKAHINARGSQVGKSMKRAFGSDTALMIKCRRCGAMATCTRYPFRQKRARMGVQTIDGPWRVRNLVQRIGCQG